jgi:DNA polymerase III subunit delta
LQTILAQKLKDNKVVVSREFVNSIFEINSLNRQDINDAINKIQLIKKSSEVSEETLKDIFYSSTKVIILKLLIFVLLGDKKNINRTLGNIYAQGINFNEILSALNTKLISLLKF